LMRGAKLDARGLMEGAQREGEARKGEERR
jgi:hypothetical protein